MKAGFRVYFLNSPVAMLLFVITCVVWALARTDVLTRFGEPTWKGVIPGLAECELAADLGFEPKRCLAIMISMIVGIICFLINFLPAFILGCISFICYFVLFYSVADDLAYAVGKPSWFAVVIDIIPPVGFAMLAWVGEFKLQRERIDEC